MSGDKTHSQDKQRRAFGALCLLSCIAFFSTAIHAAPERSKGGFFAGISQLEMEQLQYGKTLRPKLREISLKEEPNTKRRYAFFELPKYHMPYTIQARSYIYYDQDAKKLFYPITVVTDKSKKKFRIVDQLVSTEAEVLKNKYVRQDIDVSPDDKYLLIITDPKIIGDTIYDQSTATNTLPLNQGPGLVFLPGPESAQADPIKLAANGNIEIRAPYRGQKKIFRNNSGWLFSLGSNYGGDQLAVGSNNKGDLTAGSGMDLEAGYAWPILNNPHTTLRTTAAYRFDKATTADGEASSRSLAFNAVAVYGYKNFSAGLGLTAHLKARFSSETQATEKYQPALGSVIMAEFTSKNLFIGARLVDINYKPNGNGTLKNANNVGLYMGIMLD